MTLVEICVENSRAAIQAVESGAGRIELCSELALGGLTPGRGEVRATLEAVDVPVHVMLRCRSGDFLYGDDEIRQMESQAQMASELGAHGVVFGALDINGCIDRAAVCRIRDQAGDLPLTFHRAFDHVANPVESLETLIELGVQRVLTSGRATTAWKGRETLRLLVRNASGRIVVLAGGGIRQHNVHQLITETGVAEVHSSVPLVV